jgi:hypothetical protein
MGMALVRVLIIVAAFLLASMVTGYVVYGALLLYPTGGAGQDAQTAGFTFGLFVAMLVAFFAAMPAAVVIALGEFKSWRMWWYYAIAGSVIGLTLGIMFSLPHWFPWLGLGFGPFAGAIYWAIAGRKAGMTEQTPRLAIVVVMLIVALFFMVSTWGQIMSTFF